MILDIIKAPDPALHKMCAYIPVIDQRIADLAEALMATMAAHNGCAGAAIPSDGGGWCFKIGARDGGPSRQSNINISTAIDVLTAIKGA